jgi:hypothetical protein
MRIDRVEKESVLLTLEPKEQLLLNDVLNEVCHGFRVPDFSERIGLPKAAAVQLLDSVHKMYDRSAPTQLLLTKQQLIAVRNAISETVNELEEEFSTRVGVAPSEAQEFAISLDTIIRRREG